MTARHVIKSVTLMCETSSQLCRHLIQKQAADGDGSNNSNNLRVAPILRSIPREIGRNEAFLSNNPGDLRTHLNLGFHERPAESGRIAARAAGKTHVENDIRVEQHSAWLEEENIGAASRPKKAFGASLV